MTILKYVQESKVATTSEILNYKKVDPKGFAEFLDMAKSEMEAKGIPVDVALPVAVIGN